MTKKTDFGWFVFVFLFHFSENIILSVTFSEPEGIKFSNTLRSCRFFFVVSIFCPRRGIK